MDIQFYGANCITIATKQARLVIDDNLADLGAKSIVKEGDIVLFTGPHGEPAHRMDLLIDQPGEYEASNISVYGIAIRSHLEEEGHKGATLYKIVADDINILVTGHIYPGLSDAQLEAIGKVDVMVVPVGGNGYTLDGIGALKLVKKVDPKLIIPTHYANDKLAFPVPQRSLEDAARDLAMEPKEPISKLRLKAGELGDVMQLQILEQQ